MIRDEGGSGRARSTPAAAKGLDGDGVEDDGEWQRTSIVRGSEEDGACGADADAGGIGDGDAVAMPTMVAMPKIAMAMAVDGDGDVCDASEVTTIPMVDRDGVVLVVTGDANDVGWRCQ